MIQQDLQNKSQIATELEYQRQIKADQLRREREEKLYQERSMPGLHFECYDRDPIMQQEKYMTLEVQLNQAAIDQQKRQEDLMARRQVPDHFMGEQ